MLAFSAFCRRLVGFVRRRMRRGLPAFLLLVLAAGLAAGPVGAQPSLQGRVTSSVDDAPIPRASVVITRTDAAADARRRGATTDAAGTFVVEDLAAGTYALEISAVGYETVTRSVRVAADVGTTITVALTPRRYSLSEVVLQATRQAEPVFDVPSGVTVLDPAALERQTTATSDLGAVLAQTVPGLALSSGTLSNVGQTLRGRDPLVLIDGIPQTTPLRRSLRSLRTIDPSAVERIEVVRGATARYGYGATGGAINLVTKRPSAGAFSAETEVGVRASTHALSDSFSGRLAQQVSGRAGPVDYLVSGAYESWGFFYDGVGDRIPQDPIPQDPPGQGGLAGADEFNLLARGRLPLGADQRLALTVNTYRFTQTLTTETIPGVVGSVKARTRSVPADSVPGRRPATFNTVANLRYTHDDVLGGTLSARLFGQSFRGRFGFSPSLPGGGGQTVTTSAKSGLRLDLTTPLAFTDGTLLEGADVRWGADVLRDRTAQPLVDGRTYTPPITQWSAAPFAQVRLPLGDRLAVRGGARYEAFRLSVDDYTTLLDENAVAGGTLTYDALTFNASAVAYVSQYAELFASFAQGFSVADVGRALRSTSAASVTQLRPEAQTVNSYEAGVRGGVGGLSASVTGFVSTSTLGTTFGDPPALRVVRAPERIRGLEASVDAPLPVDFEVGGTLTAITGRRDTNDDSDYDTPLPNARIPPLKVIGHLGYAPSWEPASIRFSVLHSGRRAPFSGEAAQTFGNGDVEPFTRFDLTARWETGYGTVRLGVENLFDAFYFPPVSQWYNAGAAYDAAPGRRVSLTYSVEW